ncbi:WD repeat and HMG-box DNA-binding protein 1 isoform X2 [Harpegnathos saltator]|nr:WD repeat and HMG-box DNA-binding protein 1 isoform X2 [Harpegnathos saltator]
MRIQVTNINTLDSTELEGHEAPILGLSLDPKEEFVASSSADGSIRIWNIKEKRATHIWNNIVPKCNSFFTAKSYCTPSFKCTDGSCLAYPSNKDVVIVERSSWRELYRLKYPNLKADFSICKFSECGTRVAASSLYGEIVVWDIESKNVIGYLEHEQNSKITALVWHLDHSNEIAFCDALGKLGCIDVISPDKSEIEAIPDLEKNEYITKDRVEDVEEDDNEENAISLDKIKASANLQDNENEDSDDGSSDAPANNMKIVADLQSCFQPSSTPSHLLSYYMVWNDVGMVRSFSVDDEKDSSIEVEFHDATIHRSMHINNYMKHTMAALSAQALAMSCQALEDSPSKIVVLALQGWGTGNKEWSMDMPEDEQVECIAAGDNFVAAATSRRNLRIFMIGGTQREVIGLPGRVVTMNGLRNHLLIAYHTAVGTNGDQHINLLWIQVQGVSLRSQTLTVPLSPSSDLMWLGLTSDVGSPITMDADDVVRIYDKRSCLWRVVCDTNITNKGKSDHYFVIGVSEREQIMRCILCKGGFYPPTTPRPIVTEVPFSVPLCEPESERTEKERKLWQIGSSPLDETEAILILIAHACRNNLEYRAVDICEQIASVEAIDMAIKYARRINKRALASKLESIADMKEEKKEKENTENHQDNFTNDDSNNIHDEETDDVPLPAIKKPEVEIKPLAMSQTLRRVNPFLKSENSSPSARGLAGLNNLPEKPQKVAPIKSVMAKPKSKDGPKKESFVNWYAKNKKNLQEEFPELSIPELTKIGLTRFKEQTKQPSSDTVTGSTTREDKKRKLSNPEDEHETKRSTASILSEFAYDK